MRLFLYLFWSLLVISGLSVVYASPVVIGEEAVRSEPSQYPSTCILKITISDFNEDRENGCSGTLIAPNKIATAAHCFGKNFVLGRSRIEARCGGYSQPRVVQLKLPRDSLWVYQPDQGVMVPRAPSDVAIVTLAQDSLQPWLPVAKSFESFFNEDNSLKPGFSCYLAGYGLNSRGGTGVLYTASLKSMELSYFGGAIKLAEVGGGKMRTSAEHGDSGGSLICEDEKHVATLVGVTVSIGYDEHRSKLIHNYFATTWLNEGLVSPENLIFF